MKRATYSKAVFYVKLYWIFIEGRFFARNGELMRPEDIRRIKGLPVARYDKEMKKAYLEYPDGRREIIGGDDV